VFHEVSARSSRDAKIDRLDEVFIVFQITTQNLQREFVPVQPSLGSDLRQLRLFFGLKADFHETSLGMSGCAVKYPVVIVWRTLE